MKEKKKERKYEMKEKEENNDMILKKPNVCSVMTIFNGQTLRRSKAACGHSSCHNSKAEDFVTGRSDECFGC